MSLPGSESQLFSHSTDWANPDVCSCDTESYLPSPALSLYPAVGVTAWVVLKQHGDGDARFGREPIAAHIPLAHDKAVLVLGSRTALLTYTCTGNVAFPAHLLATQCSWLGSQTRWLLLSSFHVAVSGVLKRNQIQVRNTAAAVVAATTAATIHPPILLSISGLNCHYYTPLLVPVILCQANIVWEMALVVWWLAYWPLEPEFVGPNPAEAVGFFGRPENPQYAFLRRGSKIICPMSQLCGM